MQKVECPKCTAGFNADTSRAHQGLGKLKCAWCGHVFPDPGQNEESEPVAQQASNLEVTRRTLEDFEPIDPLRFNCVVCVRPDDRSSDVPAVMDTLQLAIDNSTAKEALSEAMKASVWVEDIQPHRMPDQDGCDVASHPDCSSEPSTGGRLDLSDPDQFKEFIESVTETMSVLWETTSGKSLSEIKLKHLYHGLYNYFLLEQA